MTFWNGDRLLEGRQARTVNRHVRSVAPAVNRAVELGYLGNPVTWKLRAFSDDIDETGETAVFLDATQRKALIAAASPAAGRFLRGLELTGARPRELAGASCGFRRPYLETGSSEGEAGQTAPATRGAQR